MKYEYEICRRQDGPGGGGVGGREKSDLASLVLKTHNLYLEALMHSDFPGDEKFPLAKKFLEELLIIAGVDLPDKAQ